jgi:RIO kinase 1
MRNNLDILLSDGIIDEVLGLLQSGKEAEVYRVTYRGQIVAAKVYKDRQQRSFKHNAAYKEGRKVRNSRTQRAMDKGSRFGRDEAEDAWKSSEASTLHLLHGHGVRVPTPVMFYEGVLLMQLVTDPDGDVAPRLIDAPIPREQAGAMYRDLRSQIIGVLCCDLIHGDLSPYNVLLGAAGPTIIDFPQTISAAHNTQSEMFFRRDLDNILSFFAGLDRSLNANRGDARAIWQAYARRELSVDFVPAARHHEEVRSQQRGPGPGGPRPQGPDGWQGRPPQGQQGGQGRGYGPRPEGQQGQGYAPRDAPRPQEQQHYAPRDAVRPQEQQQQSYAPRDAVRPQEQQQSYAPRDAARPQEQQGQGHGYASRPEGQQGRGYAPQGQGRGYAPPPQEQHGQGQGRGYAPPPQEQQQGRGYAPPPQEQQQRRGYAPPPQEQQQRRGYAPPPQEQQGRGYAPPPQEPQRRDHHPQGRPNPRPPQQASRGPIEVYVKRTGTRESSSSHIDVGPGRPQQQAHTAPTQPQGHSGHQQAPREGEGQPGRRGRRR